MLRVFDIFVNEGKKILFKIGLAIIKACSQSLLAATTKAQTLKNLQDAASQLHDSDYLIKVRPILAYFKQGRPNSAASIRTVVY